mmetsp:Transcript_30018/g.71417  ORF Transcript_30018/g.71417 Transcript_30018/m.71417 type:complete len:358 (+) Transcript_30018:159-1232(+)
MSALCGPSRTEACRGKFSEGAGKMLALSLLLFISALCGPASAFSYRDLKSRADWSDLAFIASATEHPSTQWRYWYDGPRYGYVILKAEGKKDSEGYQFGDFTKGLAKNLIGKRVEKLTGKPYEFGDLTRKIDQSIKDKVSDLTGSDDYEFGDLSRWVDGQIKSKVNEYTGEDSYKFGDLTKEITRRVASGQYTLNDLFILLKGLAVIGASLSPVAGFLPVKLLVNLLDYSILNDVAGKVASALAIELDRRVKGALLGNEEYKLGDATKSTIANAINGYTGKEEYEFGDITKKVVAMYADDVKPESRTVIDVTKKEDNVVDAIDLWDSEFSEKHMKEGLAKIDKYVEEIEMKQRRQES